MGRLRSEAIQLANGQEWIKSYVLIFGTCNLEWIRNFPNFFFFFFKCCSQGIWKFPDQGSNWSCSCQPTSQPQTLLSHVWNLYHSSLRCWILNSLREARDWTHVLMDPIRFIIAEPWGKLQNYYILEKQSPNLNILNVRVQKGDSGEKTLILIKSLT